MRFDLFASARLNISRNKAAELIKNGKILLDGKVCTKPSLEIFVGKDDEICDFQNLERLGERDCTLDDVKNENLREDGSGAGGCKFGSDEASERNLKMPKIELVSEIYVGRGALKLKSFLASFALDVVGKNALDIGSSTGGFVQILLQNGASSVTALDVGSSQLDESLRNDERVRVLENTDIRTFAKQMDDSVAGKFATKESVVSERTEGCEEQVKIQTGSKFATKWANDKNLELSNAINLTSDQQDFTNEQNTSKQISLHSGAGKFSSNLSKQNGQIFKSEFDNEGKQILKSGNIEQIYADKFDKTSENLNPKFDTKGGANLNENLKSGAKAQKFDLITCDVSFISLLEILPAIDTLADANCDIIVLFKPQFEVGRAAKRNKKGVVTDAKAVRVARAKFELAAANLGWVLRQMQECEVKGKEGNAEFFYAFNKK